MAQTRTCTACVKTPGEWVSLAFTSLEGKVYPERRRPCLTCKGALEIEAPNEAEIRAAVAGRPKNGRPTLRSKRPDDERAYYVWRIARFHGGADVTLPMMATLSLGRDPWKPELDALADRIASEVFGTRLAGASRWATALGYIPEAPAGLPASAYPCGPVADADKPEEEAAELT